VTGATPAFAKTCSASCKFSSGSISCKGGSTATCSCDAIGNFTGSCYNALVRKHDVPDIKVLMSDQQTKNLDTYLKSLASLGPKGVEIAEGLGSVRKAVQAGDSSLYLAEQDKVRESLRRMDKKTQKLITSRVTNLKQTDSVPTPR
jgi:hypothetical protein